VTITYPEGYTNEYSLDDGDTWLSYAEPIVFTENGSVIARVSDGKNYVNGSSQTVSGIDKVDPACGTYSGEATSWGHDPLTVTLACTDEGGSGCEHASYSQTYTEDSTTATFSKVIKDNAGNQTTCTKQVNTYIDTKEQTINLDSIPSTSITKGDSYALPSSSNGVSTVCKVGSTTYTNVSGLPTGTNDVVCTATSRSGVTKQVSKQIVITYKAYTIKNTITNGDFSSGMSYWGLKTDVNDVAVESGALKFAAVNGEWNTSVGQSVISIPKATMNSSHKYYFSAMTKSANKVFVAGCGVLQYGGNVYSTPLVVPISSTFVRTSAVLPIKFDADCYFS